MNCLAAAVSLSEFAASSLLGCEVCAESFRSCDAAEALES
jgi:hypothetical protein